MQTAKAAGMQVYGIYDDSSAAYAAEIKATAHRYLATFRELLD